VDLKASFVQNAYENFTSVDVDFNAGFNHVLRMKMICLKFNILFGDYC
jgi:hypothetical protein